MASTNPSAVNPINRDIERFSRSGKPGHAEILSRGKKLREHLRRSLSYIDNLHPNSWPFGSDVDAVYPIDQMLCLKKRLGRGYTAKVRGAYSGRVSDQILEGQREKRSNREKKIENVVFTDMQGRSVDDPGCPLSDIISGIANLDHHSQKGRNIPLNKVSLYVILQELEMISTRSVKELLNVGDRQARKYVKACGIALPFLARALPEAPAAAGQPSLEDRLAAYLDNGE
ncbi:hypothetical protein SAMN05192555_102355 [Franzmannia pantelleriensis]|uniref:Uncharacterized protein n=1 Tax=Franzmannia pantelleriensis TaxID=48727 RepID=A0A1G9H5I3_9GAMM|nr:hypothetical protein [Halomonas pantelleriensis]SDL08170.1 hypothetical protein SAMN05192555_102355 [Halomonas pantelleriensis]